MQHRVRHDYVVHLGAGRTLGPGEVFEPSPEVLENQGYKLDPLPAPEQQMKPEPETREVPKPPKDRAIKPGDATTK